MEQIIYEQAFKEHCVTSNNKMKGKKHLKWVALFRRHASSSKAMSLRKTVNLSYFFFFQDLARTITGGCKVRGTWDGENTNTNSSVDKYQNRSSGAAQRVNTWNTDYMHSNLACIKPPHSSLQVQASTTWWGQGMFQFLLLLHPMQGTSKHPKTPESRPHLQLANEKNFIAHYTFTWPFCIGYVDQMHHLFSAKHVIPERANAGR